MGEERDEAGAATAAEAPSGPDGGPGQGPGPETPDAAALAALFLSLAACDAPSKAWAVAKGGGFQSVHNARNVPKNGVRRWVRTWDAGGVPSSGFPMQLGDDVVALGPSPSRTKLAILRKGGGDEAKGGGAAWAPHALEVWGPAGLVVSVPCATHGAVFADEYFGGRGVPCWSPDEKVVAYVAERKPTETPVGFWDEARSGEPTNVPGAEWAHKDDLGERYQGLRAPRVYGVNLAERRAFCMTPEASLQGTGIVACGQPTFDPTGNSLVFTGWLGGTAEAKEHMGPYPAHRTLGVIFCNNRPSSLFDLRVPLAHELKAAGPGKDVDVGLARRILPAAVTNARSAAFSPCGLHLAYLSAHNIAKGTHESTAVLSVVSRENTGRPLAFGDPKEVCGAVDAPSAHPDGFPGLFCTLLPSETWVEVDSGNEGLARYRIVANSTWRSAARVVVINPGSESANDVYPLEFKAVPDEPTDAVPVSETEEEGGAEAEAESKDERGEGDAGTGEASTAEGDVSASVEETGEKSGDAGPSSEVPVEVDTAQAAATAESQASEKPAAAGEEAAAASAESAPSSDKIALPARHESPCSWTLVDCYVDDAGRATLVAVRQGFNCPPELHCASVPSASALADRDVAGGAMRWAPFASAYPGVGPQGAHASDAVHRMSVEVLQVHPSVPAEGLSPEDDTFEAVRVRCGADDGPKGVIVIPHGGPHSAVTHMWLPSATFFCALGYDLLFLNFRGSTGFGQAQLESLPGKVGRQDVDDCISCLDAAGLTGDSALPLIVNGGSHGGFLSAHLIGQFPGLFCAAIMRNPGTDLPSKLAVTDSPDWCHVEALGGMTDTGSDVSRYADLYADPETLAVMHRASPSAHVAQVKAPVLMLIGGKDRRVPPSQGLAYANELRRRDVSVKTNFYPEDGHALDRPQTELDCWVHAALFIAPLLVAPERGSSTGKAKEAQEGAGSDEASSAEAANDQSLAEAPEEEPSAAVDEEPATE